MYVFRCTKASFNLEVEKMFTSNKKLKYLFCLNLDPQIKFSQTCVKKFSTFLNLNILKNDHDFHFLQLHLICEQLLNKFSKKRCVSTLFWVRLKLHKLFRIFAKRFHDNRNEAATLTNHKIFELPHF